MVADGRDAAALQRALRSGKGQNAGYAEQLQALVQLITIGGLDNYSDYLKLFFNWGGEPYTLDNHYPFEPLFDCDRPKQTTLISGRQVSKSTSLAALLLFLSVRIPYLATLVVTPLYEQIRKFSTDSVLRFLDESPLKASWVGSNTTNQILQRSFKNMSKIYFSFAGLNCARVRGISVSQVAIDEAQGVDPGHLAVILETMSAARWGSGTTFVSGTPLTMNTLLQREWAKSSMGEWAIQCTACRKVNIACLDEDLERMIGPYNKHISRERPGLICASSKCGKPLSPREGRWLHRKPDERGNNLGLHIPQPIMPMHCEYPEKWARLLAKQSGAIANFTPTKYVNECLGESRDTGAKLVTEAELKRAACLTNTDGTPLKNNTRDWRKQMARVDDYIQIALGVDWTGGGEESLSFTKASVVGIRGDGRLNVIYGEQLMFGSDAQREAQRLLQIFRAFRCSIFAHDFNGAGNRAETYMVQAGLPLECVYPFVYFRTNARDLINLRPSTFDFHRSYYHLDKARSLALCCDMIKLCRIQFFAHDHINSDNPGLINDFLALMEGKTQTARAGEVYGVHRDLAFSDDFAHATNFACCALWQEHQAWPDIAHLANLRLTDVQDLVVNPPAVWDADPEAQLALAGAADE